MTTSICPADNWWALFDKNGESVKVKVVFFEIETTEATPRRRAIVFHPVQKILFNALEHSFFIGLAYDIAPDPTRRVSKETLLDFLKNAGASSAPKDLADRIKAGLAERAAELYVDQEFDEFVEKEGL